MAKEEKVKVKVLKSFTDKESKNTLRSQGAWFMASESRASELVKKGFVQILETAEPKEKKEVKPANEKVEIKQP